MRKSDVLRLKDKDKQLREYLGGLEINMNCSDCNFWECDSNCKCYPIDSDVDLTDIKSFMLNHNLSNELFLTLAYNYLKGNFVYYQEKPGELITELQEVLKPLKFGNCEKQKDNSFFDQTLKELVTDVRNPHAFYVDDIRDFMNKYNLSEHDFMVMAKTWINYRFSTICVGAYEIYDDFLTELGAIIQKHGLSVDISILEDFVREEEKNKEDLTLLFEAKAQQKRYLKAMKKLLESNPHLAKPLIRNELKEYGVHSKRDIKKLIKK